MAKSVLESAQERVDTTKKKIDDCKASIERAIKTRDKKIAILNEKLTKLGYSEYQTFVDNNINFDHFVRTIEDTEVRWDVSCAYSDVETYVERINKNLKDIPKLQETLKKQQEAVNKEKARLQYIQDEVPEVIKEFLLNWKNNVAKYYINLSTTYAEDYAELRKVTNEIYYNVLKENPELVMEYERRHLLEDYDPNKRYREMISYSRRDDKVFLKIKYKENQFDNKYDNFFKDFKRNHFDEKWLNTKLTREMNDRLVDLMTRVCKVTGPIVDASYLHMGNEGHINGYIIGEEKEAYVQTIGAAENSMYMRFHYRTIVSPKKD